MFFIKRTSRPLIRLIFCLIFLAFANCEMNAASLHEDLFKRLEELSQFSPEMSFSSGDSVFVRQLDGKFVLAQFRGPREVSYGYRWVSDLLGRFQKQSLAVVKYDVWLPQSNTMISVNKRDIAKLPHEDMKRFFP